MFWLISLVISYNIKYLSSIKKDIKQMGKRHIHLYYILNLMKRRLTSECHRVDVNRTEMQEKQSKERVILFG